MDIENNLPPPARLPDVVRRNISAVALPDNYQYALAALQECFDVDQCAEWSNKAAAAASYYKQSNNMEMEHLSQRIRLRARLRCKQILDSLPAMETDKAIARIGMKAAESAKLGDALKVRETKRNELIDATPPITLPKLARIGNPPPVYVPQPGTGSAPGFSAVLTFWKMTLRTNGADEGSLIDPRDAAHVAKMLRDIESWTQEFERHMPKVKLLKARK